MRRALLFFSYCLCAISMAQVPFTTLEDRFYIFANGRFEKMEPRPPKRVFTMEGKVVYEDHDGHLKVFLADDRKLFMLQAEGAGAVDATRLQLAWLAADTLKRLVNGMAQVMEVGVMDLNVQDELIGYTSVQGMKLFHEGNTYEIPLRPHATPILGSNTFLYPDTAGRLMLFHDGLFIELATEEEAVPLAAGRDIAAWWDPVKGCQLYHGGTMEQLTSQRPLEMRAAEGTMAYTLPVGGLHLFSHGRSMPVTERHPTLFELSGPLLLYVLDGQFHVVRNGEPALTEAFIPEWWAMHKDMLVYMDLERELWGLRDGEHVRIGRERPVHEPALFGDEVIYISRTANHVVVQGRKINIF